MFPSLHPYTPSLHSLLIESLNRPGELYGSFLLCFLGLPNAHLHTTTPIKRFQVAVNLKETIARKAGSVHGEGFVLQIPTHSPQSMGPRFEQLECSTIGSSILPFQTTIISDFLTVLSNFLIIFPRPHYQYKYRLGIPRDPYHSSLDGEFKKGTGGRSGSLMDSTKGMTGIISHRYFWEFPSMLLVPTHSLFGTPRV